MGFRYAKGIYANVSEQNSDIVSTTEVAKEEPQEVLKETSQEEIQLEKYADDLNKASLDELKNLEKFLKNRAEKDRQTDTKTKKSKTTKSKTVKKTKKNS